jgi:hypothetical protein
MVIQSSSIEMTSINSLPFRIYFLISSSLYC